MPGQRMGGLLCLAASVAQGMIRAPYTRERDTRLDRAVDPVDAALLGSLGVAMLLPIARAAGALERFDVRLPAPCAALSQAAGAGALAFSLVLFERSHRDLGPAWQPVVAFGAQPRLVERGVYARIRHPMYASQVAYGLGQALLVQNRVAGPATLAVFALFYARRAPREEAMMRAQFGEAWEAYTARTGGLLPRRPPR